MADLRKHKRLPRPPARGLPGQWRCGDDGCAGVRTWVREVVVGVVALGGARRRPRVGHGTTPPSESGHSPRRVRGVGIGRGTHVRPLGSRRPRRGGVHRAGMAARRPRPHRPGDDRPRIRRGAPVLYQGTYTHPNRHTRQPGRAVRARGTRRSSTPRAGAGPLALATRDTGADRTPTARRPEPVLACGPLRDDRRHLPAATPTGGRAHLCARSNRHERRPTRRARDGWRRRARGRVFATLGGLEAAGAPDREQALRAVAPHPGQEARES